MDSSNCGWLVGQNGLCKRLDETIIFFNIDPFIILIRSISVSEFRFRQWKRRNARRKRLSSASDRLTRNSEFPSSRTGFSSPVPRSMHLSFTIYGPDPGTWTSARRVRLDRQTRSTARNRFAHRCYRRRKIGIFRFKQRLFFSLKTCMAAERGPRGRHLRECMAVWACTRVCAHFSFRRS